MRASSVKTRSWRHQLEGVHHCLVEFYAVGIDRVLVAALASTSRAGRVRRSPTSRPSPRTMVGLRECIHGDSCLGRSQGFGRCVEAAETYERALPRICKFIQPIGTHWTTSILSFWKVPRP